MEKLEHVYATAGKVLTHGIATVNNSVAVPQKIKH